MNAVCRRRFAVSAIGLMVLAGLASAQEGKGGPPEIIIHRVNPHVMGGALTAGSTSTMTPQIGYHGGPVMGIVTPYLIWYGNWNQSNGSDTPSGQQLVRSFLYGLSGSNYYKTNASYASVAPGGLINPAVETAVAYPYGAALTDGNIASIVSNAIAGGFGPAGGDTAGVYLVLTSSDVNASSGFCTKYCGWHTYMNFNGRAIKYSFVGNANRCLNACAMQSTGPNGNAGVDGMLSVVTHELEEANTDPQLNAWYNARGYENADMCAWTFGSTQFKALNGAWANMTLACPGSDGSCVDGKRSYLIQRQLAATSKCYIDYVNLKQ